jgi:hypothetical protein
MFVRQIAGGDVLGSGGVDMTGDYRKWRVLLFDHMKHRFEYTQNLNQN